MNDFFFVVDSGTKSNIAMFSDVKKMDNAMQISSPIRIKNKVLWLIYKAHTSIKVNQCIDLPFKSLWDKFSIIQPVAGVLNWVIITNWSIRRFSISQLKELSENDSFHLVMIYLDTFDKIPDFYKRYIKKFKFDLVYTMDMEDAKKYGWIYTNSLYSKNIIPEHSVEQYDLYFVGEDKGRCDKLEEIYTKLTEKGLICLFKIINNKKKKMDNGNLHFLHDRIDYDEILNDISKSKGILELVQEGQDGMTMRPYEALFYNKRLLTNNPNNIDAEFFDNRFMKVFSDIDQSVVDFLKSKETVNYNYNDQYSPIKWLKRIPSDYTKVVQNNND